MKKDNSKSTKKNTKNSGKSKKTKNPWAGVVIVGSSLDSPEKLKESLEEMDRRYLANQTKK